MTKSFGKVVAIVLGETPSCNIIHFLGQVLQKKVLGIAPPVFVKQMARKKPTSKVYNRKKLGESVENVLRKKSPLVVR